MFPAGFPDFSADQRCKLKALGVCDQQVTELRHALISVRHHVRKPAANTKMAEHLAEIERLASELSRKLRAAEIPDAARMIEERYWPQRPADDGATVAAHLCPRLDTLSIAAGNAAEVLPKGKPSRARAGNPEPVRCIDDALHLGWTKAHGSSTAFAWINPVNEEAEIAAAIEQIAATLPAKGSEAAHALAERRKYPEALRPSVSTGPQGQGRAFPDIVGICYDAVGYKRSPKRALEAYVKACNRNRKDLMEALDVALSGQQ